jgi:predicted amidohydrolase YtcJ
LAVEKYQIPLLYDRHSHPVLYSVLHRGVNLAAVTDNRGLTPTARPAGKADSREKRELAIDAIRHATRSARGDVTIAWAWNSSLYQLDKESLDDLPPVVVFEQSLHGVVVNDRGLAWLREFDEEAAAGVADQAWIDRNLGKLLGAIATRAATADGLREFYDGLLNEQGILRIDEMLLPGGDVLQLFDEAGLADRTEFWAAPELYDTLSTSQQAKVRGIKLFADGALGTRTAALSLPCQNSAECGELLFERKELEAVLRGLIERQLSVAIHAIGDRAIDQVVAASASVLPSDGSDIRIEHAQFISEDTAREAKRLGIRLCMQPNFSDESVFYADRLPDGFGARNNPFRILIDAVGYEPGNDLFFGSDGMPHGWQSALRQSLFPASGLASQVLTIEEFQAGYCVMNTEMGQIGIGIDTARRTVEGKVCLASTSTPVADY